MYQSDGIDIINKQVVKIDEKDLTILEKIIDRKIKENEKANNKLIMELTKGLKYLEKNYKKDIKKHMSIITSSIKIQISDQFNMMQRKLKKK